MIGFGIVFGLFLAFILLVWFDKQGQSYRVVVAGKEAAHRDATRTVTRDLSKFNFTFENKTFDIFNYEIFVVEGDSMENDAKIYDNDVVFVQKLDGEDRLKIEGSPVLVIERDKNKDEGKEGSKLEKYPLFKLRRFISYVNVKGNESFNDWFDKFKEKHAELSVEVESIKKSFEKGVNRFREYNRDSENISLIFSQTGENDYSFHPMKFLYGKVEYSASVEY